MSYIIYKHTLMLKCEHKGWSYIGQTIQEPKRRWKSGSSYRDQVFGKAIKKYGWDNFEHSILKDNILTVEEANYWEEYYIKKYHTYVYDKNCRGYNVSPGGYNRDNYGKSVLQLDINKNIISEFVSICEASRAIDCSPDRISRCCNYPESAHEVKGYFWCFKKDFKNFKPKKIKKIQIYQLDANKNIINKFNSIAEAGIALGHSKSNNITLCLNGTKYSAYGYYWCKVEDYDNFIIKKSPWKRAVYCIETNKKYDKISEAAKEVGCSITAITHCCKKQTKSAAGYTWVYLED